MDASGSRRAARAILELSTFGLHLAWVVAKSAPGIRRARKERNGPYGGRYGWG